MFGIEGDTARSFQEDRQDSSSFNSRKGGPNTVVDTTPEAT